VKMPNLERLVVESCWSNLVPNNFFIINIVHRANKNVKTNIKYSKKYNQSKQ